MAEIKLSVAAIKKKNFWRKAAMVLAVVIMVGCIVGATMAKYIMDNVDKSEVVDLNNIKLNYTTILYAQDEATGEYYEFQRLHGNENRIWVDYKDIPKYVVNAAIALEDRRFNTHNGVDWQRTILSGVNMVIPIYEGKPGGSTITQQFIKNYTDDDDVRVDRKVREIFHALALESVYSKEQIIEAYLNTISLGNNTNGVQAAANLYFDKDVKDLTLAQSAAIVSITQNPTRYNPFVRPENLKVRQEYALSNMLEQNLITKEEYDEAMAEELVIATETAPEKINSQQNWFVDQVIEDAIDALIEEKGYTYSYAESQILRGGYRIYTTVDLEMQEYLETKYIYDSGTFPAVINKEYPESAFVVLGLNGEIKAIVGSNRVKEAARIFNRARDAIRHPGSTIKPIAVYAPAMENNVIYYSMILEDSPITLNGRPYPKNFYVNPAPYLGDIGLPLAIMRSTNTIPVKLVQEMGPNVSFNFMRDRLHFSTLVESVNINGSVHSDINLSPMALGEMTNGVTPLEMAAAYQIFGNGGLYYKPYSFTKILDSEDNLIIETKTDPERAISAETAQIMNRLLQGVTTGAWGTGTTSKFGAMPIAGKTGTSNDDKNQWFIGVTPYYVGVCWLGYDTPATINYWNYPPPIIWKNIMGPIHQNLPVKAFPTSVNVVTETYCVESGMLATEYCTTTDVGWYKKSAIPDPCSLHDPNNPDYVHPEYEDYEDNEDNDEDNNASSSEETSSSRGQWNSTWENDD